MDAPNVEKVEYQLLDIGGDGFCSLMDENGDTKEDLKIPEGEVIKRKKKNKKKIKYN